ncbi:MAG TPA: prepilin-type N-terminal cleavage/methylation domain-containing protein [Opitutaceae bacterium]|nr:prepilin-type N-terminal cleavage/methylation domain-containing protein [Opitutaceae bacterium]
MKSSLQRSTQGFTLIEVMLAAAIMLAGIVGAIQVLVSGSEMLETSRKQAAAMQIIDSEIARVRMSNLSGAWSSTLPSALANGTTTINLVSSNLAGSSNPTTPRYPSSMASYSSFRTLLQNSSFACTRTVSFALSRTDYKQVTFTVTWSNHNGRTYTRTGTTYVGKNGLYVSYQR